MKRTPATAAPDPLAALRPSPPTPDQIEHQRSVERYRAILQLCLEHYTADVRAAVTAMDRIARRHNPVIAALAAYAVIENITQATPPELRAIDEAIRETAADIVSEIYTTAGRNRPT